MNTSTALATAETAQKPVVRRPISRRVVAAIELLVSGEARTLQAAANAAGISRQALYKAFNRVDVQEEMERRRKRAMERLKVSATGTLQRLMESAASEHVQAQVALKVAARELEPEAATVNVGVQVGYVVNLSGAPLIEHQRQDEAKPLIDHGDGGA